MRSCAISWGIVQGQSTPVMPAVWLREVLSWPNLSRPKVGENNHAARRTAKNNNKDSPPQNGDTQINPSRREDRRSYDRRLPSTLNSLNLNPQFLPSLSGLRVPARELSVIGSSRVTKRAPPRAKWPLLN